MVNTSFFKFVFGFVAIVFLSFGLIVAVSLYDEQQNGDPQRIACPQGGTACEASS